MPMIDIGIKVFVAADAGSTVPVTDWKRIENIVSMPAMIQPSSKIATDFIGDEFTSEILGKRALTALDFVIAYDTGDTDGTYRFLADASDENEQRWLRVEYPDGTLFEMLVETEVSLVAPVPSGEIDYTLSVTPQRHSLGDLIMVTYPDGTSPLDEAPNGNNNGNNNGNGNENGNGSE